MQRYMERFGFYAEPPLDYPDAQMSASGVRKGGRLVPMTSGRVDVGRVAIGQGDLFATPLQMATVAQTIGERRRPPQAAYHGQGRRSRRPDRRRGRARGGAARGVGQDGERPDGDDEERGARGDRHRGGAPGVEVAGKTGTAELNTTGLNQPWFMCFTPDVAVAITLERFQGGIGGIDAAPIAKQVLEALGQ